MTDFRLQFRDLDAGTHQVPETGALTFFCAGQAYLVDDDMLSFAKIRVTTPSGLTIVNDAAAMDATGKTPVVAGDYRIDSSDPQQVTVTYATQSGELVYVFRPEGRALSISVQGTQDMNGMWSGTTDYPGPYERLELPGTLSVPTVAVPSDPPVFGAKLLDITRSQAQDFDLSDPKGTGPVQCRMSTAGKYLADTKGVRRALREVLMCCVSEDISDVFVRPSMSSDRRTMATSSPWTMITALGPSWDNLLGYLDWRAEMGMTQGLVYPHAWWEAITGAAGTQSNGQTWYPAADPDGFATFCAKARKMGLSVSGYTLWGVQTEGTPAYDPNDRILDADGSPRLSVWGPGKWLSREESIVKYMDTYLVQSVSAYSWTALRYDVSTYGPPTIGNGNSVDATAGSFGGSLQDAIASRRNWMAHGRNMVEGHVVGEGSRITHKSDMPYLYAGVVDATHSWMNSNAGKEELDPTLPTGRTINNLPMPLEYVWGVENQWSSNTANNPSRFFSVDDMDLADPGQQSLYPYSRRQLDRLNCFHIALGRTGSLPLNGTDFEHYSSKDQQVAQYYIHFPVVQMMQMSGVPQVVYHGVAGEESFADRYRRSGQSGFRHVLVELRFPTGLRVWVNRSSEDWVATDVVGVPIVVPPDGYFATSSVGSTFFAAGSCSSAFSGGQRVDFFFLPGQLVAVDGRGSVDTFLNMPANKGVYVHHVPGKFVLRGDAVSGMTRTDIPASA